MPVDTNDPFEELLLKYLLNKPYLVAYAPLDTQTVLRGIAQEYECAYSSANLSALEATCGRLCGLLSSFEYYDGKIHMFDEEVLIRWLYRIPEEAQAAKKPHGPVVEELLNLIADHSTTLNSQKDELELLLGSPTGAFTLAHERAVARPPKPFIDICPSSSRQECLVNARLECMNKLHFEPVITNNTDVNIGDCSYLDTCYKGKGCKYVHYQIVYPDRAKALKQPSTGPESKPSFYSNGERMSDATYSELPAQWISCDMRKFDLSVLGQFAAIIADPPWDIHMNGNTQMPTGVITDEEVLSFKIGQIQTEGVFFLWVTGRALDVGRQCLKKWGYGQIEEVVWCKTNQLGRTICTGRTGHWLNHSKEHCLMGTKGSPSWLTKGMDVEAIVSATRDKSHKPDELYDMIERMVGPTARKLELFGREHNIRPQWLSMFKSGEHVLTKVSSGWYRIGWDPFD